MSKLSAYTALTAPQPNDVLPIVDVNDTTMASSGTTKRATVGSLTNGIGQIAPSSMLIPMYIYPSPLTAWNTVNTYASTVKYIVANASSGPGTTVDSNYATAIANAQAAGITVLGYVNTGDGGVSTGTVQTQIGYWKSLYNVTSIFFDNAATSSGELSYYTTVCGYVSGTKVLNHGAIPNQGYAALGDILVVFESPYSSWASFSPASWFSQYSPSKFAVFIYDVIGPGAMFQTVTQAQQYNIGNIHVSDEADDNFSALPTYLAAEVSQLAVPMTGYLPAAKGAPAWSNVETAYGAVSDAKLVRDGVTTSSSTAFTSATAGFTIKDVGKTISIGLASGVALNTTIAAYVSGTQVTLAAAPGSSVTGAWFVYGTDSTTAFQNAFTAGGVVYAPGNYLITSTVTRNGSGFSLMTNGLSASSIYYTGTGDCFRIYDSALYSARSVNGMYIQAAIYCVNPTAAATGLHIGDILRLGLDVLVQDFNIASCIGVHFDNAYQWTEQMYGRIWASGCTSNVVFDVSGASTSTGSFDRPALDIFINQSSPAFDGVVLQNGAVIIDPVRLNVYGNFVSSSSSLSSAVVRVTGSVPGGHTGGNSGISGGNFSVGVECTSGAHTPQTIVFGNSSNFITNCTGALDFGAAAAFAATNAVTSNFSGYTGKINGDATLLAASWTAVYGGFPSGWVGSVKYRLIGNGDMVAISWALAISTTTVISGNETVISLPSGFYYPTDTKFIAGNISGGGVSTPLAFAAVGNSGTLAYEGPAFTVSGSTAYWYGSGVYPVVV